VGLERIGFENLNGGKELAGLLVLKGDSVSAYMFFTAADETLFHIPTVEFATLPTAARDAKNIKAKISPYSTAVAALVDRISL